MVGFFCLFFLLWFVKLEINRTKAELRSNQKTMGGEGGEERRHHFFLFDLAGLYKYDLQMKISPKKLPATQAKEFIITIWKKNLHNLF